MDFQTSWSWLFFCPKAHLHLHSRAGSAEEGQLQSHRWDMFLRWGLCCVLQISGARVGWSGLSCHVRGLYSSNDQLWLGEMSWKWKEGETGVLQSFPLLLSPGGPPFVPSAIWPTRQLCTSTMWCGQTWAEVTEVVAMPSSQHGLSSSTAEWMHTKKDITVWHKIIEFLLLYLKLHRKWCLATH